VEILTTLSGIARSGILGKLPLKAVSVPGAFEIIPGDVLPLLRMSMGRPLALGILHKPVRHVVQAPSQALSRHRDVDHVVEAPRIAVGLQDRFVPAHLKSQLFLFCSFIPSGSERKSGFPYRRVRTMASGEPDPVAS